MLRHRRGTRVTTVGGVVVALVLGACSSGPGGVTSSEGAVDPACAAYAAYGRHPGTQVTVMSESSPSAQTAYDRSWSAFEACTGISVVGVRTSAVATDLMSRIAAGDPPDLAVLPSPGTVLLRQLVSTGQVKAAPDAVAANLDRWYNAAWRAYGTVDGSLYATPLDASMSSLVWYSPTVFRAHGYSVPTTWSDMLALSDRMAAGGLTPWCGGLAAATSSGWPATDWLEEVVLRQSGGDVYDAWVTHDVRFDSPEIIRAMDAVAFWMKNASHVNGGIGGVASIAATGYLDAGRPVLDGTCGMFEQGASYADVWASFRAGVRIGPDGDVYAFYLPPMDPQLQAVVGDGELLTAFSDRTEVEAVQTYLSSAAFASLRAAQGGWVSPNNGVALTVYKDPVDRLSGRYLGDLGAVFRLDASELMPSAVGAGAECRELTAWFAENTPTKDVLDAIDAAWPPG